MITVAASAIANIIPFSDPTTISFRLLANERSSPSLYDRYVSPQSCLFSNSKTS